MREQVPPRRPTLADAAAAAAAAAACPPLAAPPSLACPPSPAGAGQGGGIGGCPQDCHGAQRRRRGGDGAPQHHPRGCAAVGGPVPGLGCVWLCGRCMCRAAWPFILLACCVYSLPIRNQTCNTDASLDLWGQRCGVVGGWAGGRPPGTRACQRRRAGCRRRRVAAAASRACRQAWRDGASCSSPAPHSLRRRLGRCANIITGEDSSLPRVKPFKVRPRLAVRFRAVVAPVGVGVGAVRVDVSHCERRPAGWRAAQLLASAAPACPPAAEQVAPVLPAPCTARPMRRNPAPPPMYRPMYRPCTACSTRTRRR